MAEERRPVPRPLSNWHLDERLTLTRGERAADWLRNGMGSWTFVVLFGVVSS